MNKTNIKNSKELLKSNKFNKSKRMMVGIPEGTDIYDFLFENDGKIKSSKWEVLNQMVKQLPKSKADRADKIITNTIEELTLLYPESKNKWPLIRKLICTQLLGIEFTEEGYVASDKRRLSDEAFEELKKL